MCLKVTGSSNRNLPLVSIVIPVYNQSPKFLRCAIQSALSQTYRNIEVLVSDNHSEYQVEGVIGPLIRDTRLRIIKPLLHLEMCDHFNFAIREARGALICPLCSDDELYADHVEVLLSPFLESSSVELSFTALFQAHHRESAFIPPNVPEGYYDGEKVLELAFSKFIFSFGCMMIKSDVFRKVGGLDCNIKFAFDVDFIFRASRDSLTFISCKRTSFIRLWERDDQRRRAYQHLLDLEQIFKRLSLRPLIGRTRLLYKRQFRRLFVSRLCSLPWELSRGLLDKEEVAWVYRGLDQSSLPPFVSFLLRYRETRLVILLSLMCKAWFSVLYRLSRRL